MLSTHTFVFATLYLLVKAAGAKTPQPSPTRLSVNQESQESVGTPYRVSSLRERCLRRDRYRCVISRRFDQSEASRRQKSDGNEAKDDEGCLLKSEEDFEFLEVAHILPHSLMSLDLKAGQLVGVPNSGL